MGLPQDIATESTSSAAPGAPKSNVDASVLNNIKSRYEGPQVNADNFQLSDVTPEQQAEMDKLSYMERNPATGPLSLTDYYPDVNNPVGVGSYSGSMIGSTTLFAPGGGLVPLGMMDARDKAIQDAAYSKAKEYDAFRKMYQAPTTKLVNIQPEISSEYNKMLQGYTQEAKKKYGSQWAKKLETDQNFLAKNKAFQDLAKYGDSIVESKAKLDEAKKTGKYTVTPALIEAERKLMSATDPNSPEFKKLGDYYRSFNMDLDFNDVFNETVKQIAMQQDAAAGANTSDPEYIRTFDSTTKYYNQQSINAAIESMKAQFPQSDYFTPEYIEKNVRARMSAVQEDKKAGATQKREARGADIKFDINQVSDEEAELNGSIVKEGGKVVPGKYEAFDGYTLPEPIDVVVPVGTKFTDLKAGGTADKTTANVEGKIGGIYNAYVYENPYGKTAKSEFDGLMVDKDLKNERPAVQKGIKVVPMVDFLYTVKNAKGDDVQKSVQVPLSSVKNSLLGKKGQNKEFVEEYYKKAKKRTEEYKKSISKNKPKSYQQGLNDNVKSKDNTGKQSAKKETMKTKSGITFTVEG